MDVALKEYEYINLEFVIDKTKEEMMDRAVRVKETVSKKIARIFDSAKVARTNNMNAEVKSVVVEKKDTSLEENNGNVISFKDINSLPSDKPFEKKAAKVVLYTKQLREKTERYSNKFKTEVKQSVTPDVVASEIVSPEPSVIPAIPVLPSNALNENITTADVQPAQSKPEDNNVIPDNWDDLLNNMPTINTVDKPVVEPPKVEESVVTALPTMDFEASKDIVSPIPEPTQVGSVDKTVTEVGAFDNTFPQMDFANTELTSEPLKVENTKPFDPLMLNDNNTNLMPNLFENSQNVVAEDDFIPSKTAIKARVIKVSNDLKDAKKTIVDLKNKIEALEARSNDQSRTLSGYVAAIENAVKEKEKAVRSISQLQQEKDALEAKFNVLSETSSQTIENLKISNAEELQRAKNETASIKEQYEVRIANMTSNHNSEIKSLNDQHKREMNAVYSAITEVLGDSKSEEDYSFAKAA